MQVYQDISMNNQKSRSKKPRRKKITEQNIIILKPGEQEKLFKIKYKIIHLKNMCKHYNQRISGNKDVLIKRLYEYLKYSIPAQRIQKTYKRHLLQKYILAKGPAFIHRSLCVNETDFFTMEPVSDIVIEQFISFKDDDGKIYGFDIVSLYNLWLKCPKPHRNPYNRNVFPSYIKSNCEIIYKFSRLYFNNVITQIDNPSITNDTEDFESSVFRVFQEINELGNYADHTWFMNLTRTNLIRFIREIVDIWNYRADLNINVKCAICPPHGNPFMGLFISGLPSLEWDRLRQTGIRIIQSLVTSAPDASNRSLGAYYVLCALTLVSEAAATSIPWLYDSVVYY